MYAHTHIYTINTHIHTHVLSLSLSLSLSHTHTHTHTHEGGEERVSKVVHNSVEPSFEQCFHFPVSNCAGQHLSVRAMDFDDAEVPIHMSYMYIHRTCTYIQVCTQACMYTHTHRKRR